MTIIFSICIAGHHLEYMHHIYDALKMNNKERYVFVLPEEFVTIKDKFEWPAAKNIHFDYIPQEELNFVDKVSLLKKSFYSCRILKKYIDKFGADSVYDNSIIGLLPFAPFILGRKIKLCGIIYTIYLYRWKNSPLLTKLQDIVKYIILVHCKIFLKILILNDAPSARHLNRIYRTTKFDSIADPYIPIKPAHSIDIREEFQIEDGKTIFSHFGAIDMNKGTLEILESLKSLPDDIADNSVFLFVGRVGSSFRKVFYEEIEKVKNYAEIRVMDEFCSYEMLAAISEQSDALLIPYRRTSCSSGTLGYASQFHTPVIAPDKGLLGKLVRKYKLGLLLEEVSEKELQIAYRRIIGHQFNEPTEEYVKSHSVKSFQEKLITVLSRDNNL